MGAAGNCGAGCKRCLARFCRCWCAFWRLMPPNCFAAFVLSLAGIGLSLYAKLTADETFDALLDASESWTVEVGRWIWTPFIWVGVVNLAAVAVSCAASQKARTRIWDTDKRGAMVACCRCMAGPCATHFVWILVVLSFIGQLAYSYAIGLLFFILEVLMLTCKTGETAEQAAQSLFNEIRNQNNTHIVAGNLDVAKYCDASSNLDMLPQFLFIGACVTVVSQAAMLVGITADAKRVVTERRVAKVPSAVSSNSIAEEAMPTSPVNNNKNVHRI